MQYLNVEVRPMTINDMPNVLEIERLCFTLPWKEKDFLYELNDNPVSEVWVVELSAQNAPATVVGYCDYWHTFDSGTISKIAVHPTLQHRQLGTAMMDEIISDCMAKKIRTLTLEVRKSNEHAIRFYEKNGFKRSHIKPGYYSDGEDAIYMILEVNKNA